MKCKKLEELPVVNEWQSVYCPDCKHFHEGECNNPSRISNNDVLCPFDGKKLPVKEIVETK